MLGPMTLITPTSTRNEVDWAAKSIRFNSWNPTGGMISFGLLAAPPFVAIERGGVTAIRLD
jgi:hypothetical protein